MKVSIIPWIVRKLKLCFALVEDGDTTSQNIAQGKFVIWKGVCCKAASAITVGETLSGTNLPAISGGALNDISDSIPAVVDNLTSDSTTSALSAAQGKALKSAIPAVVNNLTSDSTTSALSAAQGKALNSKFKTISSGSLHDIKTTGMYYLTGGVTDKPLNNGGYYSVTAYNADLLVGTYTSTDGYVFSVVYMNNTWRYRELALNSNIVVQSYNISSVASSTNLEMKTNDVDITKSGYIPISAIVVGTWDETQWVHTVRFNGSYTSMTVKSLHIGSSGSTISFAVRVAYLKNSLMI